MTVADEGAHAFFLEVARGDGPPVVAVLGRDDPLDRILVLDGGADACVTKPYSPPEFSARLRAIWRRTSPFGSRVSRRARLPGWLVDLAELEMRSATGRVVHLTTRERDLLEVLMQAPMRVLSRDHLVRNTRRGENAARYRSVDVLIGRLRRKLRGETVRSTVIYTVGGGGYQLICGVEWLDKRAVMSPSRS